MDTSLFFILHEIYYIDAWLLFAGLSQKISQLGTSFHFSNPIARSLHHRFRFPFSCDVTPTILADGSLLSNRSRNARWAGARPSGDSASRLFLVRRNRRNISSSLASRRYRVHSNCRQLAHADTMYRSVASTRLAGASVKFMESVTGKSTGPDTCETEFIFGFSCNGWLCDSWIVQYWAYWESDQSNNVRTTSLPQP